MKSSTKEKTYGVLLALVHDCCFLLFTTHVLKAKSLPQAIEKAHKIHVDMEFGKESIVPLVFELDERTRKAFKDMLELPGRK